MKYINLFFLMIIILITSCKSEIDDFDATAGSVDFTTYLAFGNSLTAGYSSGALSSSGQKYSYPSILAQQFKKVGMQGEFKQPMMPTEDGVGLRFSSSGFVFNTRYILGYKQDCLGQVSLSAVSSDPNASQADLQSQLFNSVADDGPFNNVGVPGLKSTDAISPISLFNPFYARFKSDNVNYVLDEVSIINPSFFTLWLGSNDVLLYALTGGTGDDITDVGDYSTAMDSVVNRLTKNGAKGAIANIPEITSIPVFTTVPYNALVLTDQNTVDALNAGYAVYNATMEGLGLDYRINFTIGPNALVISDTTMPVPGVLAFRQIKSNELLILSVPQDSIKCAFWGSMIAIPKQYTLIESQIDNINQAIIGYNNKIAEIANLYSLALVDMNTYLTKFENGMVFDGMGFNTKYITGGLFGLGGDHLNPRGYAVIANHFIEAINRKFSANIPQVNLTDYPGTQFP
ncbi:MAG: SGNH/GDSL hydrolase family protein [Bacteroidales bacterium]|nr:SGNH/GDSL hydrolase family protein [Bacteroidales bacterium]